MRLFAPGAPAWFLTAQRSIENALNDLVGKKLALRIRTITASTTAAADDHTLLVNATGAAVTVTLPPAAASMGRVLAVKKTDASVNAVTLDGNGAETIDGAATKALTAQWASHTVQCDGTAWFIL